MWLICRHTLSLWVGLPWPMAIQLEAMKVDFSFTSPPESAPDAWHGTTLFITFKPRVE